MNSNDFWDGKLLGLTFIDGKVNSYGESRCIDQNTHIYVIGNDDVKNDAAKDYLEEKGFVVKTINTGSTEPEELFDLFSPDDLKNDCVLVSSSKSVYRRYSLATQNHKIWVLLFDNIKLFYELFLPKLRLVYEMLDNDFSKETYTAVCLQRFKVYKRKILYPYIDHNQYFCIPEQMVPNRDDVFLDIGGFVGDTVENYIKARGGVFKRIYSFEPYGKAFNALKIRTERLKKEWMLDDRAIVPINGGCGTNRSRMSLALNGTAMNSQLVSSDESSDDCIEVYSIDEMFKDENVTFIKADIEGMELDMLRGAQEVIKRDKPNLAICIYHKITDYFEIPLYIKSLVPEYRMQIRHHSSFIEETVLYCYLDKGL